jgi:hypothetical protein
LCAIGGSMLAGHFEHLPVQIDTDYHARWSKDRRS